MAPQKHLFFPFIIFLSFINISSAGYTSNGDQDPHHGYYSLEPSGYLSQAYPSYISAIEDQVADGFDDSFNHANEIFRLEKLNDVHRLLTSALTVNVDDFGAKGTGLSDDTEAFKNAWKKACSSTGAVFLVPQKNYLVKPIKFSGPCKSDLTVQIYGIIEASDNRADYDEDQKHWLVFDSVENLIVQGGGTINGNGMIWWKNSCKVNKALPCKDAPTALTFDNCENLVVKNLKIQNAQQIHVSFQECVNVQASDLVVTAPEKSPNTDGIHVTGTRNIQISSSVIGTGDDCISIVSGSQKVQATDITCGPGHGISIGSLGSGKSKAFVSDVLVNGARFFGTTNGARIKTWPGGSGNAINIKFQNLEMHNVANPIIIDENYCDQHKPCEGQSSAIQVKDVIYENIKGTSASEIAIKFDCSKNFPCQGITLQNINIQGEGGSEAKALCKNVRLNEIGMVSPHCL